MELRWAAKEDGRLSTIVREEMGLSYGLMNRLKWQNRLLVNGVPRYTNYPVRAGDVVTALLDEPKPDYPAELLPLDILYEDAHILAVDKPAGMLIHPSRSQLTGTLANRVIGYYQQTGQSGAFHPVTRLDRDTYGVVLLGKNSHAHAMLSQLHTRGELEKVYEAAVLGRMPEGEGEINAPIARRELPSLLRYVNPEGKPAQTRYQVLEQAPGWSLVRLWPLTGRTHQLRVHCAYVGCPILGDPQYGTAESLALSRQMGLESQRLCARWVRFVHPLTGEKLEIQSRMTAMPREKPE